MINGGSPVSDLSISDLGTIFDKSIEPIDRVYFVSYNPIIQIGFIVTSSAIITWSFLRQTGWKRLAWMTLGSIPLLVLLARNLTADRQRRMLNDRFDRYANATRRINDLFDNMPDLDDDSDSEDWAVANA